MTGGPPGRQASWPGDTPVFGDFWDRAAGLLRPPGQPDPPPGPQQLPELAVAMRGLAGTVGRYLDDVRIDMGIARGNPDVWNQALAAGRGAARSAATDLDCPRCAAVWPQLRDRPGAIQSDSLAGRLAAAVTSLTVARDLLHTHFTAGPDGLRAEHSDWAPVIASAPVNRALLAGLADHARRGGPAGPGGAPEQRNSRRPGEQSCRGAVAACPARRPRPGIFQHGGAGRPVAGAGA